MAGDNTEAVEAYSRCLNIEPNNKPARENIVTSIRMSLECDPHCIQVLALMDLKSFDDANEHAV